MGTAAGTKVFLQHGWRPAAALSLGWMGFQLGVLLLRGPHNPRKRWMGWKGGWTLRQEKEKELSPSNAPSEGDLENGKRSEEARGDNDGSPPSEKGKREEPGTTQAIEVK